jgi:hypothetical protein
MVICVPPGRRISEPTSSPRSSSSAAPATTRRTERRGARRRCGQGADRCQSRGGARPAPWRTRASYSADGRSVPLFHMRSSRSRNSSPLLISRGAKLAPRDILIRTLLLRRHGQGQAARALISDTELYPRLAQGAVAPHTLEPVEECLVSVRFECNEFIVGQCSEWIHEDPCRLHAWQRDVGTARAAPYPDATR